MEGRKFIKKFTKEEDGKTYLINKFELRDINLTKSDWDWIYEYIMCDDYEIAQSNGFYESESCYYSIDCQMVGERMSEWIEEIEEEYEETLEDKSDDFQNNFKRIEKILEDNIDFTIYYEDKEECKQSKEK